MTPNDDSTTPPHGPLAPVRGSTLSERALVSFDEADDETIASLLETHHHVGGKFKGIGTLLGVLATAFFWWSQDPSRPFWQYMSFMSLSGYLLGFLGSRYYLRGEAKRLGLSRAGLKEYLRRRWRLTTGADVASSINIAAELAPGEHREARLKRLVGFLREVPPKS